MKIREFISDSVIVTDDLHFYLKVADNGKTYVQPLEPREENDLLILYSIPDRSKEGPVMRHFVLEKAGSRRVLSYQTQLGYGYVGRLIGNVVLFCRLEPLYNRPGDSAYFLTDAFAVVDGVEYENCLPADITIVEDRDFVVLIGNILCLKAGEDLRYLAWQESARFADTAINAADAIPFGLIPLSEIGLTEADLAKVE